MYDRLTWAEINLPHYRENVKNIRQHIGSHVKMMAVVKANAYGHGIVEIGRTAEKMSMDYFGVVCMYEAILLRKAGIRTPILILNYTDQNSIDSALNLHIALNIMDEKLIAYADKVARKKNMKAHIHIKIDTGLCRLGLSPDFAKKFIMKLENYHNIKLEGIFTHFATSDEKSLNFTKTQVARFNEIINYLKGKNIKVPLVHSADSAATLRIPESHYDMVRPGMITYGLAPSNEFRLPFKLKPVLSLKTQIVQIHQLHKGESVGYSRAFTATKNMLIAIIPVGYGDGFRRAPKHWKYVLIRDKKAQVIGRVSMDQTIIDVSQISGIKVGDETVLIGSQENEHISVEDVATQLGTINYEVITTISSRVSRIYIK